MFREASGCSKINYPLSNFTVKKLQSFFMGKKCYEFAATSKITAVRMVDLDQPLRFEVIRGN